MEPEDLLVSEFFLAHPEDAAREVEQMLSEEAAGLLLRVEAATAARVVEHMAPLAGVACLTAMLPQQAAAVAAVLPLDAAVRLLRRMEPEKQQELLASIPKNVAEPASLLLRFPEGTAGAVMDPSAPALPDDMSVEEAHRMIRSNPQRIYYYIYVVDRDQRLVGALDLRELMLADAGDSLRSIMRRNPVTLQANTDLASVVRHPGWRHLDALPVVNAQGVLLGMIRQRTLRSLKPGEWTGGGDLAGWGVLLSLGELYWFGMREVLELLMVPATPPSDGPSAGRKGESE